VSRPLLSPRSGLEHLVAPGRAGVAAGEAGVVIALRSDLALATVMARKGGAAVLARRVGDTYGFEPPDSPRCVGAGSLALAWAGPGQWLAMAAGEDGTAFAARLRAELADVASISDQSDGRSVIRVGGPRIRDALAKGVPVDLHPRAFAAGDVALTSVAHIGVHLWQVDDGPTYEFAVFRSFAAAFWQWLVEASAEYGVSVEPAPTLP
jgi:heterotetrameric sarcosine oxidase gamma subunit